MAGTKDIKDFTKFSSLSDNDYLLGTKTDLGGTDAGITVADFKKLVAQDVKPTIKNGYWWVNGVNTGELATGRTPNFRYTANGLEMKYDNEDDTAYQVIIPIEDLLFTFDDLTPEQVELLKLKFSDLTETEKDELRGKAFTYDDFTSEQLADLRMTWDKLTPAQKKELQGERGYSAFEVWEQQEDNSGKTVDDYLSWLRQPATNAAIAAGEIIRDANAAIKDAEKATDRANRAAEAAEGVIAGVVPTKLSELDNDTGFVTNTVENLTNYYLKSETYTRDEVMGLISQIKGVSFLPVESLPDTGETNLIYLLPKEGTADDVYNEYLWIENTGKYELIGSTSVDLSNYYTKEESSKKFVTKEELLNSPYLDLTPLFNEDDYIYDEDMDKYIYKGHISDSFLDSLKEAIENHINTGYIDWEGDGSYIQLVSLSIHDSSNNESYSDDYKISFNANSVAFSNDSYSATSWITISTKEYETYDSYISFEDSGEGDQYLNDAGYYSAPYINNPLSVGSLLDISFTDVDREISNFCNDPYRLMDTIYRGAPIVSCGYIDNGSYSNVAKFAQIIYGNNEGNSFYIGFDYVDANGNVIEKIATMPYVEEEGEDGLWTCRITSITCTSRLLRGVEVTNHNELFGFPNLVFNGGTHLLNIEASNMSAGVSLKPSSYGFPNDGDETSFLVFNAGSYPFGFSTLWVSDFGNDYSVIYADSNFPFNDLHPGMTIELNIKYVNKKFYVRASNPF